MSIVELNTSVRFFDIVLLLYGVLLIACITNMITFIYNANKILIVERNCRIKDGFGHFLAFNVSFITLLHVLQFGLVGLSCLYKIP